MKLDKRTLQERFRPVDDMLDMARRLTVGNLLLKELIARGGQASVPELVRALPSFTPEMVVDAVLKARDSKLVQIDRTGSEPQVAMTDAGKYAVIE